jgi:hypothetical protein
VLLDGATESVDIDPGLYYELVGERGWEDDAFESWLAEAFLAQLLPAP